MPGISEGNGLILVLGIPGLDVSVDLGKNAPADKIRYPPTVRREMQSKENNPTPIHDRLRAGFGVGSGFDVSSGFDVNSGVVAGSCAFGTGASIGSVLTG